MPDEPQNLPAVPDAAAVEEMVFEGEVLEDGPPARRVIPAPVRVVASPRARWLARQGKYVAAGVVVALRRRHEHKTRHKRMMRAAAAAGDHESALKWELAYQSDRKERRENRESALETVVALARTAKTTGIFAVIVMAVAGCAVAYSERSLAGLAWPVITVLRLVKLAIDVASVAWTAGPPVVVAGTVAWLHHLGRHAGDLAPRWAVAADPEDEDRGLVITADTIVLALQHMPITPLKKALSDGWKPAFSLPPVREGRGYQAKFSVPLGVTPEMLADQRPLFARNLHRDPSEVWPSAAEPGYASLYVIDRGALERAAPEYPLMHEGCADVFVGVPGGTLPRGDEGLIPIVGNNGALGGMMGQGKSNAGRVLMLGCATDPLPELGVFVFANNGDFDSYAPRLAVYRKGVEDDTVLAAVGRLQQLYEEVARREARLAELGAKKLTRQLAQQYPDMRPIIDLYSECHELFGHPDLGELAGELATKTIKRARKTGITLWFDTQSSRKEAIPPKLVELVSVNCCFAVKTWRSNDGFLGDGSFAAGIRATELRPGRDRGTALVTGISDAQFELLKWYYIEVNDDTGYDAAADVIARCMANLAPGTAVGASMPLPAIESRDLLDDLDAVLGPDRVKLRDAVALLRQASSSWYRSLTAKQLADDLAREGVKTVNVSGTMHLDPPELRRVRAERDGSE